MSKELSVILVRANWCGYCKNFEPIYNAAIKSYKKIDYFKDYKVEFKNYDIAEEGVMDTLANNHREISDKIQGYPSVFVNLKNKPNSNLYFSVEHTIIDKKKYGDDDSDENGREHGREHEDEHEHEHEQEQEQYEEAASRFLQNIVNVLKTHNSDGKILYIQGGNNDNFNDEIYKKKYLKYKYKYLKLKKN